MTSRFRQSNPARFSPLLVSLLLACGSVAVAQTTAPATAAADSAMSKRSAVPRGDVAFMKQAAQNGHAEVETSKVALSKSGTASVKTFAQQMIDDHTKAGDELASLASSKGVEVPNEPSLAQKAKLKLLQAREGASFDKHYADTMNADHKATVALFQKAASGARDPDVKAFAAKTLPTLEHHLQMAGQLKSSTVAANSSTTSSTR